jgi:hypothetical protein
MTYITIPTAAPIVQQEVRCDGFIGRNNLDAALPVPGSPDFVAQIVAKYAIALDRLLEPQDADGNQVGARVRADPAHIDIAAF